MHDPSDRGTSPLSIRLRLGRKARIGPGKVALLESIARSGDLGLAAQAMGMSPRRAWLLVDSLNQAFDQPVVEAWTNPAGAPSPEPSTQPPRLALTELGHRLIAAYRAVEAITAQAVTQQFSALEARLSPDDPDPFDHPAGSGLVHVAPDSPPAGRDARDSG